jgi:hypothetical protein
MSAARYGITRLAIFDNQKYLRHPMDAVSYSLGKWGRLELQTRLPLKPGAAGFREIRIYRVSR